MCGGSGEEAFVGDVELVSFDASFDDFYTELVLRQFDHRATGDAGQDVLTDRWGQQTPSLDQEYVLRAGLGHISRFVQHDSLIEAVLDRLRLRISTVEVLPRDLPGGDPAVAV